MGHVSALALLGSTAACGTPDADQTDDADDGITASGSSGGQKGGGGTSGNPGAGGTAGNGGGTVIDGTGGSVVTEGGVTLNGTPEFHSFVRLTHAQWANSINEIFGMEAVAPDLTQTLHPDPPSGTFGNNERSLYVGPELWADYQRTVEETAEAVAQDGAAMAALGGLENSQDFIKTVGRRAFRRPLTTQEMTTYQELWTQGATFYESGDDGLDGARIFIRALLQSPHFVYRIETTAPGSRLSGLELAAKISLLFRKTTPSEELLAAAEAGDLDTDEGLEAAVMDLLSEDSARETLREFHTELYGLNRYKNIEKSTTTFPDYREELNDVLMEADSMFFDAIFENDGGFRDVLTSPVAYVNNEIAPYYGLSSNSNRLTEVTLDETRPGFLTRVGFLSYNATLSMPDPIHRGVDINLRMLCQELSPPPGAIPPLPASIPNQTNRERVEAHTGSGVCANCHKTIINPLGFAFESFDAMGQDRPTDAGEAVDTADSYEFNNGLQSFADASELISILAEHPQTHDCYSAKLAEYLLGRDLSPPEAALVTSVSGSSLSADASIRQLVLTTVLDPRFTHAQTGDAQ
jgi:hypothetical protein